MSNNRPFLANFLAAFRAQSTYKPTQQVGTTSLSSAQISQSARTIATKAANSAQGSSAPSSASATAHHNHNHNHNNHTHTSSSSATTAPPGPVQGPVQGPSPAPSHHYHHDQSSVPSTPPSSTPIPINRDTPDRQRRGSDSSSGSGGFRDATGPEKWYIGGRTPAGEERFYRLGMVTKGGGRLGGSGRVGSIDQLSL
ncbi:hypothetical protein PENNAL_c0039G06675 [Penicillium nalgiovense]|uniref:Uncharacterized protein n=1 Tax=Penicillium nalgiovense TaxID=60175 RepID=A0A1V6Y2P0_PENNA|nr:hypothetical protein PENNAL_c0039G06675 [Penicillium nalgiovense]